MPKGNKLQMSLACFCQTNNSVGPYSRSILSIYLCILINELVAALNSTAKNPYGNVFHGGPAQAPEALSACAKVFGSGQYRSFLSFTGRARGLWGDLVSCIAS
ncbi:hypothetical protein Fot_14802 [Forsythia ovata]|uniref:Uncharacterized protein n=1 Tax=Forsythia ovata TaxID=205694 RepID=A0ABD1W7E4_9LAMI